MTKINFYGGVDEIGGNKVQLISPENSIFFDFGKSFNREGEFFSEFLQPRKLNGIMDLVEFGLLPPIKGIYREDYLKKAGLHHTPQPSSQGIFISHAHLDHMGYLHHIREDIPFYMTQDSHRIIRALEMTGIAGFNNYTTYQPDFLLLPKKRASKNSTTTHKRATSRDDIKKPRQIEIMEPYQEYELGDLKISSAPVDHSLPGSCAFMSDDGEEAVLYTGDFRFHGRREDQTRKMIKEAKKFTPTTIITEGTRMDRDHNLTESDIKLKAAEKARAHGGGLVIVNYPLRDLDRFYTFYQVAKESDRTMVVNTKQAFLLNEFGGEGYPGLKDVAVYIPRRGWGLLGGKSQVCMENEWISSCELEQEYLDSDYKGWEKDYINWDNNVNYLNLQESPGDYIFQCDYFEFKELIDIKPENAIYIKSKTEPFNDEMEIDARREKNWLEHFNIQIETGYHASGHACRPEIMDMILEINPEKVYPIHTRNKENFKPLEGEGIKVIDPVLKN
ncbi:MAG: MBL fold metallo-hydrolase [Euryarchaeota archaeon]|nr:MBL fold metallo-hydrolase [Euryarchaeota archaeon]MBV1754295.1 MBL fold metallo-hydrolase [Methanobacterium sp.]